MNFIAFFISICYLEHQVKLNESNFFIINLFILCQVFNLLMVLVNWPIIQQSYISIIEQIDFFF